MKSNNGYEFSLFLAVIFALATTSGLAQKLKIYNDNSKTPISDVVVYDVRNQHHSISDSSGVAKLDPFSPEDSLIFQHPSFEQQVRTKKDLEAAGYEIRLKESLVNLPEMVLSAFKIEQSERTVPFKIQTIDAKDIELENPQTAADVLQSSGNVLVQKSQLGGGSPILRGFEANRILLVVDGVRMNNAIYRGGHLQNSITIDNAILDRVEVLFGPASVIYGSDALGGVVHFYTRKPTLSKEGFSVTSVNTYGRYSSASNENTGHLDLNIGFKKWAIFSSVTSSKFGDLEMGALRHKDYPDFGKITQYADRIEGRDTVLANGNQDLQRGSGYNQTDFLQKIYFEPNKRLNFTINTQYSTSSDIPRFDRLTEVDGNGVLRYARWDYGPQNRFFSSVQFNYQRSTRFFDGATTTLAYQNVEESRINRRFGNNLETNREENVQVYSWNLDLNKKLGATQMIQYGFEYNFNDVGSEAHQQNILTGIQSPATTRYADGGSFMQSAAVYGNYRRNFKERTIMNLGLRYNLVSLESKFEDTAFVQLPFEEIGYSTGAFTWSLGVVHHLSKRWQLNAITSSGFRAPNVDDSGKIFDNDDNLVVPNEDVNPEFAYNWEIGATRTLWGESVKISATAFYVLLTDALVRRDHEIMGVDSLVYEGELLNVQTNVNVNRANIFGYALQVLAKLNQKFTFTSTLNQTFGEDLTDNVPLGHIPPLYGKTSVMYKSGRFIASLYSFYNGWKRIEDYAPSGVDNEDQATTDGTPAWYTLNLRSGYALTENFQVQLGIENILDRHYKPFASGISAPGRNFVFTVRGTI